MRLATALPLALSAAALLALTGCPRKRPTLEDAGARPRVEPPEDDRPGDPPSGPVDGGRDAEPTKPGSTYGHCDEDNKQIYVVSETFDLYRFPPALGKFVRIGRVRCPGAKGAFSMAVDRAGMAWVLDSDGSLFKVSTKDASCRATGFARGQRGGSSLFGMAFVVEERYSDKEKLYVADSTVAPEGAPAGAPATTRGIAVVDTDKLTLSPFVPYRGGRAGNFELTGMSDGRMYGFDPSSQPPRIVEIDPKTAALKSERLLDGVVGGGAWAVAQHYGDFYVFAAPPRGHTRVTKVVLDAKETKVVADLDFAVVGAGVSTCAPSGH